MYLSGTQHREWWNGFNFSKISFFFSISPNFFVSTYMKKGGALGKYLSNKTLGFLVWKLAELQRFNVEKSQNMIWRKTPSKFYSLQKWSSPPKISFWDHFEKYCFFFFFFFLKKLLNKKYSKPHFLHERSYLFLSPTPLSPKRPCHLTNFLQFLQYLICDKKGYINFWNTNHPLKKW